MKVEIRNRKVEIDSENLSSFIPSNLPYLFFGAVSGFLPTWRYGRQVSHLPNFSLGNVVVNRLLWFIQSYTAQYYITTFWNIDLSQCPVLACR